MSATAPTSPVVAAAGRELALLAFVGQELRRARLAGQLMQGSLDALHRFRQERVSQLYQVLFGHFELQGDWRSARLVARAVLRRAPDSAAAHQQLGSVALRQGDADEAFAQLRRAVALGAQSPLLLRQLADLYLARDSAAEAILALRAAGGDQTLIGDLHPYQDQADQIVAQERARTDAPATPRGGQLRDSLAHLSYYREFLSKALLERRINPTVLALLQRDLSERSSALAPQPKAHGEAAQRSDEAPSAPAAAPPSPPPPRAPFDWVNFWSALFSERMLRALLYLGATLLVASAFIWMAFNWGRFSAPVQLGVLTGITGAFYGSGILLRNRLGLARSGITLIAIGASWVAVDGWALANPGLLDLDPAQAWLLISALCLAAYLATVLWLRAEVFSALAGLAGISLLLSTLNIAHVAPPWWGNALLLLLTSYMVVAQWLRTQPDGRALADPLIWIAQSLTPVVLLSVMFLLRRNSLFDDPALLALNVWIGLSFYLLSLLVLREIGFEQMAVWLAPVALRFSAEALSIPRAWQGPLLLTLIPIYLLLAPRRRAVYAATGRPWLNYPLVWPTYSAAYALSLLALIWPGGSVTTLCVGAFAAAALYAASARIFRQPLWAWLACAAGLLACWRLLKLLGISSLSELMLAWAVIGVVCWALGLALRRAPRYAQAPLLVGYQLLLITLLASFLPWVETQRLLMPIVMSVSLISAWQAWRGRLSGLRLPIGAQGLAETPRDEALISFFLGLSALLLPCWLSVLALQADLAEIGLGQALLAVIYVAASWLPVRAGLRQFGRTLIGMAVGLTLLSLLSVPAGASPVVALVLGIGWVVAQVVPSGSSPRIRILDGAALSLGLGTLAGSLGPSALSVPVLLANAGVYLLLTTLYRRPAGLYAASGLLLAAWLAGLRWLDIPLAAQAAWLAPVALLAIAAALLLEYRGGPDFARPAFLYGYGIGTASLMGCLAAYGNEALGTAALWQSALALAALATLALILALHTRRGVFVELAAALPLLAYILALDAWALPQKSYGPALAGLAALYLGLALLRRWRGYWQEDTLQQDFDQALLRTGHLLTILALLLGVLGSREALALICLCMALAYGLVAVMLRRPVFVGVAALLFTLGTTLFVRIALGPLLGTYSPLALLWLLLAVGMLALGIGLQRAPPTYVAPLHTIGLALAALAPLHTLEDQPMLLAALGGLVLLCVGCSLAARHARLVILDPLLQPIELRSPVFLYPVAALMPIWAVLLANFLGASIETQRLALALCAPVALAISRLLQGDEYRRPFLLACYALTVLGMLAGYGVLPVLVLALNVGLYLWLMRGAHGLPRQLAIALWVVFPLAGIAAYIVMLLQPSVPVFAAHMLLLVSAGLLLLTYDWSISRVGLALLGAPLIGMLGVANVALFSGLVGTNSYASLATVLIGTSAIVVYCALAALQRRPFWSIPAALATPAMLMLAVSAAWPQSLPSYPTTLASTLALFGLVGVSLAWWLDRWLQRATQAVSAFTLPLYVAAGLSGIGALLIVILAGLYALSTALAALAVAICFALLAWRFRLPLWLYVSALASTTAYLIVLDLLAVPLPWRGVALLPGIFAAFAVGGHIHRGDWLPPNRRLIWSLPPYLFAMAGSSVAVAWSLAEPWPLALALLGATMLYTCAALLWRTRAWLFVALCAGHFAYLAMLDALALLGSRDQQALWLLLPAVLMMLAGHLAELRTRASQSPSTGSLGLLARYLIGATPFAWSPGFYLAASVDMALVLLIPTTPGAAAVVAWVVAALLAFVATTWRERALALLALALLALGSDRLLVLAEAGAAVRCSTLALQGVVAWWLGQALRWWQERVAEIEAPERSNRMWATALQSWGLLANGAALLWALVPLLIAQDTLPLSRVLAVAGLLCVGVAWLERRLRLSYLGSAMLIGAWFLTMPPGQPQFYALPAGIYLLAIGAAERWQGAPRRLAQLIELLGMGILLTVSFEQSLPANFSYGMLLGFEALAIMFWGALQRVRLLFFGGIVAFLANLAIQGIGSFQAVDKALLAFAVGLALVVMAVYIERRRDALRERARYLLAQLEMWS